MQAIGFLSRREYSRHELRAKLIDALRKRAHEETQRVQAEGRRAREVADALLATPSNGIDDAFAPPMPLAAPAPNPREEREARASRSTRTASAPPATAPAMSRGRVEPLLESVRLASGDALTGPLRASLAAAAAVVSAEARTNAGRCARVQHVSAVAGAAHSDPDPGTELETEREPAAVVDELLDWLVANKYLSEERFVESRVNARARKQGTMLIKQELSRHGLALEPQQAAALRETEFARAKALWDRRFGEVGVDARARAKQARFLVSRGFAADLVRRIVGGGGDDDDAF
jgi:regulatory protein